MSTIRMIDPIASKLATVHTIRVLRCFMTPGFTYPILSISKSRSSNSQARVACASNSLNGSAAPIRVKAGDFKLIIYSKPDCPLCDGLKDKVSSLLQRAEFQSSLLSGAKLEVRDISCNPEWGAAYGLAIPVLSHAALDGSNEVKITRPSPRLSADKLERHIVTALGG